MSSTLLLKGTKHDNIEAVEKVMIQIFKDLDEDDPWQAMAAATWEMATMLCIGNAQFEFCSDSIRFGTMNKIKKAKIIFEFSEK